MLSFVGTVVNRWEVECLTLFNNLSRVAAHNGHDYKRLSSTIYLCASIIKNCTDLLQYYDNFFAELTIISSTDTLISGDPPF